MTAANSGPRPLEELEQALRYRFRDRSLLEQALTHRSHRGVSPPQAARDNERLEFLGDSIVGFVVSDVLYTRFPTLPEGKLSRIKSNLVSARHLRRVAQQLGLGAYLRLGPGEEKTGGRKKHALLVDTLEAVIAALYLDAGLERARRFVEEELVPELSEEGVAPLARADYKSALQEHLQGRRLPGPRYELADARGPEHRKTFTVELWVGEQCLGQGEGASKKAAEQRAARQALRQLTTLAERESA